jgi:hypothetical protein
MLLIQSVPVAAFSGDIDHVLSLTQPVIAICACASTLASVYILLLLRAVKAEFNSKIIETKMEILGSISDALNGYVRRGDCIMVTSAHQHSMDEIKLDIRGIREAIMSLPRQVQ